MKSVSIIVPARNEYGNIEAIVKRTPQLCDNQEIIFVEGGSTDGTWEEICRMTALHFPRVRAVKQPGHGKADAVYTGFAHAKNDILIILDADMGVSPEEIAYVWNAMEPRVLINGSRMIFPMEKGAMQFLNYYANKAFAIIVSWLIGQQLTDTLCGTKGIHRKDYQSLVDVFGNRDPWGDYELIFGAAREGLSIYEVFFHYKARTYGKTKISRFKDGLTLLGLVFHALHRRKIFRGMAQKAIA